MSKELLYSTRPKDYKITFFRGSGAGGQHRNKTDTACRIIHKESGAMAECQEFKSQHRNKMTAFGRVHDTIKFKIWHTKKINEIISGKTIDQRVEESMQENNIKVDIKEGGKWIEQK